MLATDTELVKKVELTEGIGMVCMLVGRAILGAEMADFGPVVILLAEALSVLIRVRSSNGSIRFKDLSDPSAPFCSVFREDMEEKGGGGGAMETCGFVELGLATGGEP